MERGNTPQRSPQKGGEGKMKTEEWIHKQNTSLWTVEKCTCTRLAGCQFVVQNGRHICCFNVNEDMMAKLGDLKCPQPPS